MPKTKELSVAQVMPGEYTCRTGACGAKFVITPRRAVNLKRATWNGLCAKCDKVAKKALKTEHKDGPMVPTGEYACKGCSATITVGKPITTRRIKTWKCLCKSCIRHNATAAGVAARAVRREIMGEIRKEEAEKLAETSAVEAAAAVQRAVQAETSRATEEMLLLRQVHRATASVLTPEQVIEIQNNIALIRADTSALTNEQLVHRELAIRELCKRKLIYFTARMRPQFKAGWFNIDLAERLERFYLAVMREESPRLIIMAPVRHGKSLLASEMGPAWAMGKMHESGAPPEWISASYNDELATEFSRSVQTTMRDPFYQALFGVTVSDWSKGVDRWQTSKYGKYLATGVGGSCTGFGCHVLAVEDPIKGRVEADSIPARKKLWDWYTGVAYTRRLPGAGVLVIQTRWHSDDLAGRLIEQHQAAERDFVKNGVWPEDADNWEIVSYPAIAVEDETHRKEGEALHPERYSLKELVKTRRTLTLEGDPRDWASLYQQTPVAEEGAYFTRDMLHFYDGPEPAGMVLAAGDLAVSTEQWADNSVFLVGVLDADDTFYVYYGIRKKMDSTEIMDTLFAIQAEYKPTEVALGKDVIEKSLGPVIDQRMMQERMYDLVVTVVPHQNLDKATRARPIQNRMRKGKVKFKRGAPFLEWLLPEVLGFPNAKKDDAVDTLANLGYILNDRTYVPPPVAHKKSWRDKLDRMVGKQVNKAMAA